ncbi:AbiH family protein [Francisella sp. SYW-9]|uniref:AbiH family protein n=1 Tax=Francisella sp. SYW-9 TaxID=2610888 RepID=UPI00123D127F|nr:AbiH family protein [Francisella sp. SYW-9]
MRKLYIIGNGFDIAHDLKTSYKNFYDYLKKQEILAELKSYIERMDSQDLFLNELIGNNKDERFFWTKWEKSFSTVAIYAAGDFSEEKASQIKDEFTKYLNKWMLEKITPCLSEWKGKYLFDDNDLFLSFNYLGTLEKVYSIRRENIIYIHGKSENEDSKLIFGSSSVPKHMQLPNSKKFELKSLGSFTDAKSLEEYIAMPDKITIPAAELSKVFYKDISTIINENNLEAKYKSIEEIHIIGHSIGCYDSKLDFLSSNSNIDDEYYEVLLKKLEKLQTVVVYEYKNTAQNKIKKLKDFNDKLEYKIL